MIGCTFDQLVDIEQVRQLLESHHQLSGMAYGLFDTAGNNLIAVGWQDICVQYHRINPVTSDRCRESNAFLLAHRHDFKGDFLEHRCGNGMIDVAFPILISGEHLATLYAGQFFYDDDRTDTEFFRQQAVELGFEMENYLSALEQAPVFSREYARNIICFLGNMVNVLSQTGLSKLTLVREMAQHKGTAEALSTERSLFVAGPTVVFKWKAQDGWPVEYVSPNVMKQFGYIPDQLVSGTIPFAGLVHPDDLARVGAEVLAYCEQGVASFEQSYRLRHADGTYRWIQDYTSVIRGEKGGITHFLGYVFDITERKRMEDELLDQNLFLDSLLNAIPIPVFFKGTDARYAGFNKAYEDFYGKTREELIGKGVFDLFPPEQAQVYFNADAELFRTGGSQVYETPFRDARGVDHTVMYHKAVYFDKTGEVNGQIGVILDITERKLMEERLAVREREFRTLAENSPDNIIRYDRHGYRTYANAMALKLFGVNDITILQNTSPEKVHFEGQKRMHEFSGKLKQVLKTGEPDEVEISVVYPTGDEQTHNVRFVAERDADGAIVGVLAIGRDITERKRMEDVLTAKEREFRTLAENSPDNIARFDCHCRQIYVNPTMERSLGLDPTWLLGKTPIEQATDDTSRELGAAYEQRVRRVLETGEPGGMEVLMPNPSGGLDTHLIRIVAERDTVGTVVGALAIGRDITERKQAEEALYKSELRLQLHVQHTPLGVIEWDADFRVVSWNPAAEKLFGYTAAEAIGRHAEFIVPLSVRPHVDRVMNDLLRCSGGERSTNINVTKDGRELIGEWYNTPLVTADGQVIGIASLMHDITERKRLEDALAAREREFRAIVENSPDTVSRYDRECRRTYINPTMAELLGRSAREDVGTKPTDQSPMPETVLFEQKIRDVFETGREFSLETPYKTSSGEAKWGHLRVVPEFASDGTIVSVLSIGRDINDLKEAEQALRENEQQFRTLSENSPNIIIRYNLECRRIYVNTAFTHEMGIPAETALNSTLDDVWLSEIKMPMEEYRSRLRQVMGTGAATELILEWRRPDTDHSSFHVFSVVPEKDQDGRISGCLAIGHNITEWRKAEHALNDKRKQLALIERELSVAEERERLRIASVLHDHIGQILLLGKMKLGALAAVPKPELVGSVIDEVRELLEQATNDAHSLTVQLNPPMLSVSGLEAALQWLGRKIESDYSIVVDFFDDQRPKLLSDEFCSILYQCARELLINAAKHAKSDKARLTVGREDDMYRLTVEDRGAGFNPDDIIPNISRDCRFGLFSIHVRIERLGGRMNIESSPGCGTLITILLPLSA